MGNYEKVDKAFFFFKKKYENHEEFSKEELQRETGWSEGSIKTYMTKRWSFLLEKIGEDYVVSKNFAGFDKFKFRDHHSQNK